MSLGDRCRLTRPGSPKTVGHGDVFVHGAGDVTLVSTSEARTDVNVPGRLPGAPSSAPMTRNMAPLPCRTTSPHEAAAPTRAASPTRRDTLRMRIIRVTP